MILDDYMRALVATEFPDWKENPPVPVKVDNVANMVYIENPKEFWNFYEDFPNIAPPFERAWYEWNMPRYSNSEGKKVRIMQGKVGVYVTSYKIDGPEDTAKFKEILPEIYDMLMKDQAVEDLKWLMLATVFGDGELTGNRGLARGGSMFIGVDPKGKILHKRVVMSEDSIDSFMYVVLLSNCLMHCKNVGLTDNPVPEKVAKKRRLKDKFVGVTWKTLNLLTMQEVLRNEGGFKDGGNALQTALHIVRGHFADYTERGLFGKVKGVFWKEMHARGKADNGEIKKQYEVGTNKG